MNLVTTPVPKTVLRRATTATIGLALVATSLTGCAVAREVKKVTQAVEGNKATIDAFDARVQGSESSTFEATYVTTGSSPATIVYAVQPPKGVAFTDTPSTTGSGGTPDLDVFANSSGEYACTPASPGSGSSGWSCEKLGASSAASENQLFDFYTPAHWVSFLKGLSLAAGLAGDKVSSSSMTVNGFAMSCIDFQAPGVPGTSTICTATSQNILGYVRVASDSTSFELKSYSSSPPSSLFELPPGAKVTTLETSTTG